MKVETNYHREWQNNRMDFILSKYPEDFFKGKKILELGSHNGFFGESFRKLGADVLSVEGRAENVTNISLIFPDLKIQCSDLDTDVWEFGYWDIIINFGLFYHLENHHEKHLENCLNNCDLLFFESVIYDSYEDEIYFKHEGGGDQSLSTMGGTPSTSYVENIFKKLNLSYEKYSLASLNGNSHHYDWEDTGLKKFDLWSRRFWIVKK